jgi:GT2 family glycosyltransferase
LQSALVSYYVGCGHALRRSVVQQHGGYRADMVYGAEELDLAYRMINAGFSIAYEPRVTVEHHPQPSVVGSSGRRSSEHYYQVRNRIYLAYRYLPWRYAVPYVGSWLARYALRASKEQRLGDMLRGVCSAPSYLRNVRREVVSRNGLAYLTAHGGRLWY